MKIAFFLLVILIFFSPLVSASQIWKVSTGGEAAAKPVAFSNGLAIVSSIGEVYLLNPASGSTIWRTIVNGTPLQPVISQNKLVVATTNGKVALLGAGGTAERQLDLKALQNVTYVYGVDGTGTRIFLTTDRGVVSIGPAGDTTLIYKSTDLSGTPTATGNSIIFADGTDLVKTGETGVLEWRRFVGGIWKSKPVVDGQVVYVGSLDNGMHALTLAGGINKWIAGTGNWVLSTPLVKDGIVYFGSNDGNVYAVDQTDGSVIWKTQTPQAIETRPEPGQMGGKSVIFVGSTANSIYAMNIQDGSVVWKGPAEGWVGDPVYYQDTVIFGSADKSVYSYSTERACAITAPQDGATLGYKEVKVAGNAVSRTGSPKAYVRVNEGDWQQADMSGEAWQYYLDPSATMNAGLNTISCKATDSAGEESGVFTEIAVTRDTGIALSDIAISFNGSGAENEPLTISAHDARDGSPVERFKATIDAIEYTADGDSINVTLTAGSHAVVIKKMGYNDATAKVDIHSKGMSPVLLGAGALALIIILWLGFSRLKKR